MEKNSRVEACSGLGSAGTGDLLGRGAPGSGKTLELSMLRLGHGSDVRLFGNGDTMVRRNLGLMVLRPGL